MTKVNIKQLLKRLNINGIRFMQYAVVFTIAFLFLVLGAISFFYLERITSTSSISQPISNIIRRVDDIRQNEKEFLLIEPHNSTFFKTRKSKYVDKIDEQYTVCVNIFESFETNENILIDGEELSGKLKAIKKSLVEYKKKFDLLVKTIKTKGNQDYGLSNQLIKQSEQIQQLVNGLNNDELSSHIEELKRNELMYFANSGAKYTSKLANLAETYVSLLNELVNVHQNTFNIADLMNDTSESMAGFPIIYGQNSLQDLTLNQVQKDELIKSLENYISLANNLYNLDEEMGIESGQGLKNDISHLLTGIKADLSLLEKKTQEHSLKRASHIKLTLFGIFILITTISVLVLLFNAGSIIRPIERMKGYIKSLIKGVLPDIVDVYSDDEMSEMQNDLNHFVESLKAKAEFANEIGRGNLNISFKALGDEDILGVALLTMQNSLQNAEEEDVRRRDEDKTRNWATDGINKFGDVLRRNTGNLQILGDNIARNLVDYLGANQGGVFLYNDEDKKDIHLELIAAYAYNRKKFLKKRINLKEGLVGTCAVERKTIYMTKLPKDYIEITSGLGEAPPSSLLLVPLIFNQEIFGVVELASFKKFQKYEIEFVEQIGENLASALSTVKVNVRTSKLLEQTKSQADELVSQEEEMRQNMEELQATQEESARRTEEMTAMWDALDNATPVMVFDRYGRILDANNNFLKLLKANKSDVVGRNHLDFHILDNAKEFWGKLRKGEIIQSSMTIKVGQREIELNETYSPIYDSEGQVSKILTIASKK